MAEFDYQPTACQQDLSHGRGPQEHLQGKRRAACCIDEIRYFFYITNDRTSDAEEIVFVANDRCDQENLIAQLQDGVQALTAPVDNLESNWAYMVMTALAWNLKAWAALRLPETGRWAEKYRAEKRGCWGWSSRRS